jgi:hypothetical protein
MTNKKNGIKRYDDGLETLRLEGRTLYLDGVEVKNIKRLSIDIGEQGIAELTITKDAKLSKEVFRIEEAEKKIKELQQILKEAYGE